MCRPPGPLCSAGRYGLCFRRAALTLNGGVQGAVPQLTAAIPTDALPYPAMPSSRIWKGQMHGCSRGEKTMCNLLVGDVPQLLPSSAWSVCCPPSCPSRAALVFGLVATRCLVRTRRVLTQLAHARPSAGTTIPSGVRDAASSIGDIECSGTVSSGLSVISLITSSATQYRSESCSTKARGLGWRTYAGSRHRKG